MGRKEEKEMPGAKGGRSGWRGRPADLYTPNGPLRGVQINVEEQAGIALDSSRESLERAVAVHYLKCEGRAALDVLVQKTALKPQLRFEIAVMVAQEVHFEDNVSRLVPPELVESLRQGMMDGTPQMQERAVKTIGRLLDAVSGALVAKMYVQNTANSFLEKMNGQELIETASKLEAMLLQAKASRKMLPAREQAGDLVPGLVDKAIEKNRAMLAHDMVDLAERNPEMQDIAAGILADLGPAAIRVLEQRSQEPEQAELCAVLKNKAEMHALPDGKKKFLPAMESHSKTISDMDRALLDMEAERVRQISKFTGEKVSPRSLKQIKEEGIFPHGEKAINPDAVLKRYGSKRPAKK
ncbi:Uncharacterised protein [uncultured archaeon]|nr:Uncharacterised protein [uncultured archaeon]